MKHTVPFIFIASVAFLASCKKEGETTTPDAAPPSSTAQPPAPQPDPPAESEDDSLDELDADYDAADEEMPDD